MSVFVVSGSRRITDYALVAQAIDDAITQFNCYPSLIIEGGQRTYENRTPVGGVDYLAELWALRHRVPHRRIDAEWSKYGKSAGPRRNRVMAAEGQYLVAIPDSASRGTLDMIAAAKEAGIPDDRILSRPPMTTTTDNHR